MPTGVERIASKAMGAVKRVRAATEGLTGVFAQLAQEHGEVSALLARLQLSEDPELRAQLFPAIRQALVAHEKGELRVVYPAYRAHGELAAIAEAHDQEAAELSKLISDLHVLSPADPRWGPKLDVLIGLVEHHTTEEENEYFPKAQAILGREGEALLDPYLKVKAQVWAGLS